MGRLKPKVKGPSRINERPGFKRETQHGRNEQLLIRDRMLKI